MTSLLQEVTRSGTAAQAQATLKRTDIYGKTGTTNDSMDAWFAGWQPNLVGGGLDRLRHAAQARRPRNRRRPVAAGLDRLHGARAQGRAGAGTDSRPRAWSTSAASGSTRSTPTARGVSSVGLEDKLPTDAPTEDERKSILDLFKR